MCGLPDYNKNNYKSTDEIKFWGGITLPEDFTINPLVSFCVSINIIDTFLNALGKTIRGVVVPIKKRWKIFSFH